VTENTGNYDIVIPDSGITLHVAFQGAGDELRIGDVFTIDVQATHTAPDCASEVTTTGTYLLDNNTSIVATCITGGAQTAAEWSLSDTAGLDDTVVATGDQMAAGVAYGMSGITVTLDFNTNLHRVGDSAEVECVAEGATGEYSVLSLSAPVGDPNQLSGALTGHPMQLEIRSVYTGEVSDRGANAPANQWVAGDDGVTVAAGGLAVALSDFTEDSDLTHWVPLKSADADSTLFVSFRELKPSVPGEAIFRIDRASQLEQFGARDADNPLGLGASLAISGSQGKTIYVGRVTSDDTEGFSEVLTRAENIEALYAHTPMTDDYEIQLLCKDHVNLMSDEKSKKWRRVYIGTAIPGDYQVSIDDASATIQSDGSGNVVVSDPEGRFVALNVIPGDLYRTNFTPLNAWGDLGYDNYVAGGYIVESVVDEETLILKSGPTSAIGIPARYEIWKKDNSENVSDFIAARSASFGSRRVSNVFVDGANYLDASSNLVTLHPMFIAAEIAGLRTAVAPQQGLTNTEVASVAAAPAMYIKYNEDELNKIAANGSFVITQEYQDGPRFIRHQLTTDTNRGNLYYEDSVGVNVDEISFQVKHALRPYIGRRNVNPETIRDIFEDMFTILEDHTYVEPALSSIGPALIGFSDLRVAINDTFKDRIDVTAKLNVPLPLNVIDVTLNATASFNQGELTLESLGISTVTNLVEEPGGPVTLDLDGNPIA
jgi:hypothetical protein